MTKILVAVGVMMVITIGSEARGHHGGGHHRGGGHGGGSSSGNATCSTISTCAEAKRLLAQGNTKLDRNHDGIPCEKLCK